MPKTYVETSSDLLAGVDRMVKERFYHDRTEAVNDAIQQLLKAYKLSKLHVKDERYVKDERSFDARMTVAGG